MRYGRKGSGYELWFAIGVFLSFISLVGYLGAQTGIDTGISPDVNESINSTQDDPGTIDSIFGFYSYATGVESDSTWFIILISTPIVVLGAYTVVSWFSLGGG